MGVDGAMNSDDECEILKSILNSIGARSIGVHAKAVKMYEYISSPASYGLNSRAKYVLVSIYNVSENVKSEI